MIHPQEVRLLERDSNGDIVQTPIASVISDSSFELTNAHQDALNVQAQRQYDYLRKGGR